MPDILPFSLAKAMTDPEKVMAPIATPSDISRIEARFDVAGCADIESRRREKRRPGDEHSRHTDQRVKRRNQLRHLRHLHFTGDIGACAAANADCDQ